MKYLIFVFCILLIISSYPAEYNLNQGLVAYYPFNGNGNDESGNGNHGTVYGATLTKDRFGNAESAYSFDGENDYISIPCSIQDDFTISFWVNTTQISGAYNGSWWSGNGLIDGEVCGSYPDFGVALCEDKAAFSGMISTSSINDGTWRHIVARRVKLTGEGTLDIDGILEANGDTTTESLTASPWLGIGNNPCDISYNRRWFKGFIDDVRLYNRVLSEEEIETLFHEGGWETSIENEISGIPNKFKLIHNYPNPFNLVTTIEYSLPQDTHVTITICSVSGKKVNVLKDKYQPAGNYSITWNAIGMPSGLYFCTMKANSFTQTKKMVLVK